MREVYALLIFTLLYSLPLAAQTVTGVTAILGSTSSTEIDTFSETKLDYIAQAYYGAYVEGYLYDNGNQIGWGSAQDPADAYGYMQKPLIVGDVYEIDSYHYVVESYIVTGQGYYNPYNYLNHFSPTPGGSSSNFTSGGGPTVYNTQYILLGATGIIISSSPPVIQGVSNPNGTRGQSGTVTLYGQGLTDVFTQSTTPSISNSGVTLTLGQLAWNQVSLNWSVASNASAGPATLSLTTRFGAGSTTFNVGDATPQLNSLSANSGQQGDNFTLTLNGKGFGANPSVQISDSSNVTLQITSHSDTQINATMAIADTASVGQDTITVTSNGPIGSGFLGNPGNTPVSNTQSFAVNKGPGFDLTPANATIDDGTQGTMTATATGGNPVSCQWSFSVPSGVGNNPNVKFSAPTSLQTNTDAHWYASPDKACPSTADVPAYYASPYTIQTKVRFDDGQGAVKDITKKTKLSINAKWSPAGYVAFNDAKIDGLPAEGRVCGTGECPAALASTAVTGNEQSITTPAASGAGSITINGDEQSVVVDTGGACDPVCGGGQTTIYDSGTVTLAINGFSESTFYGSRSTASSLAATLANLFNGDPNSPVYASASDSTVYFSSKTGGSTGNYPLSASSSTNDSSDFYGPSFSGTPSGATLTGGTDPTTTYDSGTVTVAVNGTPYSASYGQNDDMYSMVAKLNTALGSAPVIASVPDASSTILLTSKTNVPVSTSSATNLPGTFAQPSFSAAVSAPSAAQQGTAPDPNLCGGCGPPQCDNCPEVFMLSISPATQVATTDGVLHYDVKVTALDHSQNITVNLSSVSSGTLKGVTAGMHPQSVTISAPLQQFEVSRLDVVTDSTSEAGTYTITVNGNGGFARGSSVSAVVIVPPYHVTGQGTLTRVTPTDMHIQAPGSGDSCDANTVTPCSQFYNKIHAHESFHVSQWIQGPTHEFGDLMLAADFFNDIMNLSAPNLPALQQLIQTEYDSFRQGQAIAFQGRTCPSSTEAEKQAYDVSDQVAPKYIYQWCGACPVAQTE